jgi:uroporphyrinogen-III synthase
MPQPLHGKAVALAEGRQLEELARLLESEGADVLRYPLLNILDAPDPAPVRAWIDDLLAGRFSHVVLMTGEALRRLVAFAGRDGRREDFLAALARTRLVTRGPKPVQALREVGLAPTLSARTPTTEGVLAVLREEALAGKTAGYTLYGEANPALDRFLTEAGAVPRPVLAYVYAPRVEEESVVELIGRLAAGRIDAVLFTSSPQVDRLFAVARDHGREEDLRRGLQRTRVAAVGPVCADNLRERGAPVHVCPEQGFVMKNLVQQLKRAFEG